jgi:hypothetical protein
MQTENNKIKYCAINNNNKKMNTTSLFCDKCNNNQEQKLFELKKFEENMSVSTS